MAASLVGMLAAWKAESSVEQWAADLAAKTAAKTAVTKVEQKAARLAGS